MKPHLLLVDDRPENLLSLSAWLEGDDRVLVTASSGNEALGLLVRQDFALVLLDVQMPGMSGFEVAELMRGSAKTREIPIIFVTAGDPQKKNALSGYGAGAVDYLIKPVNPDILRSKVDVFLRLYRQRQEIARQGEVIDARNRELEDFARVVAHDLKEPLRLVASFLSLVAVAERDQQQREYIDFAVDGARRMSDRIDALLVFARAGEGQVDLQPVPLTDTVRLIAHDLSLAIGDAGGTILADDLPTIEADRGALEHVLQNLIANAIKFRTPDRAPEVRVTAEDVGDAWHIRVADNGIGFNPEYAARIFKVFTRLHAQGEYDGTGIGLAVCQRIVQRHGGRIWAEGQPGVGATFHFTIPKAQDRR